MKLAISNIAWTKEEDNKVYNLMKKYGFDGLEIAPTRLWDKPYEQSEKTLFNFSEGINKRGLNLVSMQSLLYGKPKMTIFENSSKRKNTLNYLKKAIDFASTLNINTLVFGSPKNRVIADGLNQNMAMDIAIEFFTELGKYANKKNTVFCIEPNPKDYKTNFINTTDEALDIVKAVNNEGFRLNIDCGAITLNKTPYKVIEKAVEYAGHFHISEPFLNRVEGKHHKEISTWIKGTNYNKYLSIEMRNSLTGSNIEVVEKTLVFVFKLYK